MFRRREGKERETHSLSVRFGPVVAAHCLVVFASHTPFSIMSDDEHQFESKADAGASKTYPQQAGTIRKGAHLVIKQRPCKVCIYPSDRGPLFRNFGSGGLVVVPPSRACFCYFRDVGFDVAQIWRESF